MTNSVTNNPVSLAFYTKEFEMEVKGYELSEEQLNFTALPIDAMAKCEIEDDRHPIVILSNDRLAGFFVLHGWGGVKEYYDNKNAILLRAYSVQNSFQGKGIAKDSLALLPSFVKTYFPDKDEIILAVNHSNMAAQIVYQKAGFFDKGLRATGRKGELYILHFEL